MTTDPERAREFWIQLGTPDIIGESEAEMLECQDEHRKYCPIIHVIEYSAFDAMKAETDNLSIKLQRTVNAAHHALLEMSAWMGIPEHKRAKKIKELMSNVEYCAKHDLRHMDESQAVRDAKIQRDQALEQCAKLAAALTAIEENTSELQPNSGHMYLANINYCDKKARAALKEYRTWLAARGKAE